MPRASAEELVEAVIQAYETSGVSATLVSDAANNPRVFSLSRGEQVDTVWIYIWTLTHGGGAARPANEFRIQITGIQPPLGLNPGGQTLLLGYEPESRCFAAFDISKHLNFSRQSPSIQISILTLREASQNGLAFHEKGNQEIAIGVKPELLYAYTINAVAYHAAGDDSQTVQMLNLAVTDVYLPEGDLARIPQERRVVVSTLSRLSRDSRFRERVLTAYGKRCAISRLQFNLIDAAHILPVGAPRSTDNVSNGICLSPTHHRAFDRGLIYLDDEYRINLNLQKLQQLAQHEVDEEILRLGVTDRSQILLPAAESERPSLELIRAANRFRNINFQ